MLIYQNNWKVDDYDRKKEEKKCKIVKLRVECVEKVGQGQLKYEILQ